MTDRMDEIRERLGAFLDRWQEMTGHDPDVIYGVGDREGELLHLTNSDLRALLAEAATLREVVQRVRSALEGHPECDRYPNVEGGISCGWKRAVADVTAALGDAPEGEGAVADQILGAGGGAS